MDVFSVIISLGIGAGLACIPANMAKKKGYGYGVWWTYGFFLFIVAVIHAACLEDKSQKYVYYNPYAQQPGAYYPGQQAQPGQQYYTNPQAQQGQQYYTNPQAQPGQQYYNNPQGQQSSYSYTNSQPQQTSYYASSQQGTNDVQAEIAKYRDLLTKGLITVEEFEAKEQQLLNK